MESQPQNPEFMNNPKNFQPCYDDLPSRTRSKFCSEYLTTSIL